MPDKMKTGIGGLDSILGGGFPTRATILLEAPPGSGKSTFCKQFAKNSQDKGLSCIYVATSEPISQVRDGMKSLGLKNFNKVVFIDAYSWRVSETAPKKEDNVHSISSLTQLNELTRIVKKELSSLDSKTGGACLVIDSLSDMLLYAEPASVFKFLQLFVGVVKGSPSVGLVVLEEGLHEPRHVATLGYICDGTIHFRLEGAERSIYVERMFNTVHPLKWIPYTLGEHGVEIKVEEFFG